MLENFINRIIAWFKDHRDRNKLIQSFNQSARDAFITGQAPVMLEARVSKGDPSYKHTFSNWLSSGFRIKVHTSILLTKDEMMDLGRTILSNEQLVRRLVVLGWDTLEVYVANGKFGYKWNLSEHMGSIHLLGPS